VTRWTATTLMARERNKHLLTTIVALDSSKTLLKITTLQKLLHRRVNHRSPETVFSFVLLGIDSFKIGEVA